MVMTLENVNFDGKHVLVRVDYNVPLNDSQNITDFTRIIASLPTIDKIIDDGGIPILMSHLGRPKGGSHPKLSLESVADFLRDNLGYKVIFAKDCIGPLAKEAVESASLGDIVLLENLRFHKEEKKDKKEFAKQLAELGDCYINDAFGTAHRAHASTHALAELFDEKYAGFLLENEIHYLERAVNEPKRPFIAIIGGAKISGKIDVIKNLLNKCDKILIGGGMMFTFIKALGYEVGNSILEKDKINLAKKIIEKANKKNVELILPVDTIVADKFSNDAKSEIVKSDNIPENLIGMDIGPETCKIYAEYILKAKTIVWNGPLGVFEMENFANGTLEIAKAMAEATKNGAITIVGGGDSAAAVTQMGLSKSISHVSTGGGASLVYLEGKILPAIEALDK